MKKYLISGLIVAMMFGTLVSCIPSTGGTDKPVTPVTPVTPKEYTEITANITEDLYLEAGKTYYINKAIYVKEAAQLISYGAEDNPIIVKFGPNGGIQVDTNCKIKADYTIFTSMHDDTVGKKIDGSNGEPDRNNWKSIIIKGGTANFNYCKIMYAGSGDRNALTVNYDGKARIDNCDFYHNGGKDSVTSGSAALYYEGSNTTSGCLEYNAETNAVTNCHFYDNIWDLSIPFQWTLSEQDFMGGTKYRGIVVQYCTMKTENTWSFQTVPYCLMNTANNYSLAAGSSLTIEGGQCISGDESVLDTGWLYTEIQSYIKSIYITDNGGKLKTGTHIRFTSYKDDPDSSWGGIWSIESKTQWISNSSRFIEIKNATVHTTNTQWQTNVPLPATAQ